MRDLHDHHARDMMLDLTGERRDVPPVQPVACGQATSAHAGSCERMALGSRGEPAGGDFGDGCGSGSGDEVEAVQRPNSDAGASVNGHYVFGIPRDDGTTMEAVVPPGAAWAIVEHNFAALLDWSVAYSVAAGPLPLASPEPWVEGDEAYRVRLFREAVKARFCDDAYRADLVLRSSYRLDNAGVVLGLPRARLAPATPRAEGEDCP